MARSVLSAVPPKRQLSPGVQRRLEMQQTRRGQEAQRTRSLVTVRSRTALANSDTFITADQLFAKPASGLRALFVNRARGFGGDWVTFEAFANALAERGAQIRFTTTPNSEDLDWASVVHCYNLCFPWTAQALELAMRAGKPVVVHAIYFSRRTHPTQSTTDVLRVLNTAKAVLVYGDREIAAIMSDYPHARPHFATIQKGVDAQFTAPIAGPRGLDVLIVGRVEHRKNQLRGIQACNRAGVIPMVVGPAPGTYIEECRESGEFLYVGSKSRDELKTFYRAARVLLQPSLYDPKPNTVLEAGLAGCRIALTTQTFYEPLPVTWTFDPLSTEAMTDAVRDALASPPSDELQRYLTTTYTWDAVIQRLLTVYEEAGWRRPRACMMPA